MCKPIPAVHKEALMEIGNAVRKLNEDVITRSDRKILNYRLNFTWADETPKGKRGSTTLWRNTRARQIYREVQDANPHLFLAFILAIPPTECSKASFDTTLKYLISLENYDPFRLNLSLRSKGYIESGAVDHGLASNHRYLKFMQALFPLVVRPKQDTPPTETQGAAVPGNSEIAGNPFPLLGKRKRDIPSNDAQGTAVPGISAIAGNAVPLPEPQKQDTPSKETQSTAVPDISSDHHNFSGAREQRVTENASLQGIARVFDEYMCRAIRRVTVQSDVKAAVTTIMPIWGGPVDCLTSLDICESEVEQLAMVLFNAKVKWMEQALHVVLKEGITLSVPHSEVTLKGVTDEAVIKVFGPEIHDAITKSPIRRRELEEGKSVTECVSMILTKNEAIINLSLGLKGGLQIQNKLYD